MSEKMQVQLSRPTARSMQEYKAWALETGRMILGPDFQNDKTDQEWK